MRKTLISILGLGTAFLATQANAATVLPACGASDISSTSPTKTAFASTTCQGFFAGNLLNSANASAQVSALNTLLGASVYSVATFDFGSFAKLDALNGLKTIDFPGVFSGMTLIGVHYGAGSGSPSDVAGNQGRDKSDSTAFYLFDAGTSLDKLYLTFGASSNVVLYSTGKPTSAVPEPATWAMLVGGFALVGASLRRRMNVRVA